MASAVRPVSRPVRPLATFSGWGTPQSTPLKVFLRKTVDTEPTQPIYYDSSGRLELWWRPTRAAWTLRAVHP